MFAATLSPVDPDRPLRWVLTAVTLAATSFLGVLVAAVWWLARWTALAILAWLRLSLGLTWISVPVAPEPLVEVELRGPGAEIELVEAAGIVEPRELLGDGPPIWEPASEPSGALDPTVLVDARSASLLKALGSSDGALAVLGSLEGSVDFDSVLMMDSFGGTLAGSGDSVGSGSLIGASGGAPE